MTISPVARVAILECHVNAALNGHDLGTFWRSGYLRGGGWRATCRNLHCGLDVWVSTTGHIVTELEDRCRGEPNSGQRRIDPRALKAILRCQDYAAVIGHDLGSFDPVDGDAASPEWPEAGGRQAVCRNCGKSVWVGAEGLIYSLLGERCQNETRGLDVQY